MKEYIKLFMCGLLLSMLPMYAQESQDPESNLLQSEMVVYNDQVSENNNEKDTISEDNEDLEGLLKVVIEECENSDESDELKVLVDFLEDVDLDELTEEEQKSLRAFLKFADFDLEQKEIAAAIIAGSTLVAAAEKTELLIPIKEYISKKLATLSFSSKVTVSQDRLYKVIKEGVKKDVIVLVNKAIDFPMDRLEQMIPFILECGWIERNRKLCGIAVVGITALISGYGLYSMKKWYKNRKHR